MPATWKQPGHDLSFTADIAQGTNWVRAAVSIFSIASPSRMQSSILAVLSSSMANLRQPGTHVRAMSTVAVVQGYKHEYGATRFMTAASYLTENYTCSCILKTLTLRSQRSVCHCRVCPMPAFSYSFIQNATQSKAIASCSISNVAHICLMHGIYGAIWSRNFSGFLSVVMHRQPVL